MGSADFDLGDHEHVGQVGEGLPEVDLGHLREVVAGQVVLRAALGHHVVPLAGDLADCDTEVLHLASGELPAVVDEPAARGDDQALLAPHTQKGDGAGGRDGGLRYGAHVIPASCSFERGVTDGLRPRRASSWGMMNIILYNNK